MSQSPVPPSTHRAGVAPDARGTAPPPPPPDASGAPPAGSPPEQPVEPSERPRRRGLLGRRDHDGHHDGRHDPRYETRHDGAEPVAGQPVDPAREKFGGVNLGACVFGWIVAVGVSVLLTGVLGALVAAVSDRSGFTQSDAERESGTVGLVTAIALLVVLVVGYYAGGYVAGRMSRFDGARQGLMVWVIGLAVTVVAVVLGAIFGDDYNVLDRVDLPRVYLSDQTLTWGAVITAVAVVAGTLVAAWVGGAVGRRYHSRVDRVTARGREHAHH